MKKKRSRTGPAATSKPSRGSPTAPKKGKAAPKLKVSIEEELAQAISGDVKVGIIQAIRFSSDDVIGHVSRVCPTGSLALDKATAVGGLPFHRVVEVYGKESVGKTTLMKLVAANTQKLGGVVALCDPEEKWDRPYAVRLGCDITKIIAIQPEQKTIASTIIAFDRALQLWIDQKKTEPLTLIWDSVAATATQEELDDLKSKQPGVAAKEIRRMMRVLTGKLARAGALLACTNQTYDIIGGFGHGPKTATSGGRAIRYHATLRIELIRKEHLKIGEHIVGIVGIARVYKNSMGIPRDEEYAISGLRGFDNAWTIFTALKAVGVLQSAGAGYYTLALPEGSPLKWQGGFAQLDMMMREDPALAAKLTAMYVALP